MAADSERPQRLLSSDDPVRPWSSRVAAQLMPRISDASFPAVFFPGSTVASREPRAVAH